MDNKQRYKEIMNQADEIFYAVLGAEIPPEYLKHTVDHLARVVGMFANKELSSEIADPLGYIESKLSVAYAATVKYADKHDPGWRKA